MTIKEKLVNLLKVPIHPRIDADPAEVVADYLLDNGVTVQQWIPVSERLPDDNTPVLVYCVNTTIQGGAVRHMGSLDSGKFWFLKTKPDLVSFPFHDWKVTHWMPLPEPPQEV